jgi:deferrochelatase/peroxidase EfeB
VDLSKPIDPNDPEAVTLLAGIQGNLLKTHGRDHTAHVFVRFAPTKAPPRKWISSFPVTSAAGQLAQTRAFRSQGGRGEPFAGLLLTHAGYKALGIAAEQTPDDAFFVAGLAAHNSVGSDPINDPPSTAWEPAFRDGPIHALVLLADDDRARLDARLAQCLGELQTLGHFTAVERGDKLRFDFGPPRGLLAIEHFGHQDGISDPVMFADDLAEEVAARGASRWDPKAGPELVLVAEKGVPGGFGSYLVFRKLEQNVQAFAAAKKQLASLLEIDVEGAAALMVGRHRDGRPVIPATTLKAAADPNDFNYAEDRPARGEPARMCPFHAHIRRTNPRGDVVAYVPQGSETFERQMRIARRGITYGERPRLYDPDPSAQPQDGVGLLFMCAVAGLRQFAIQQGGSDDDSFPFVGPPPAFSGLESVIGQAAPGAEVRPQPWPFRDAKDPKAVREFRMMNFVKLLGGEYFFAPSLDFLRSLGTR